MKTKTIKMGLISTSIILSALTFQSSFAGRFFVGAAIGLKQTSTDFTLDRKSVGTAKLGELQTQLAEYEDARKIYTDNVTAAGEISRLIEYASEESSDYVTALREKLDDLLDIISKTDIVDLDEQIATLKPQIAEYDKIVNFIKLDTTTQQRTSTSLHALAGYRFKLKNMVFITEVGLNHLPLNMISDGSGNGIEVKKTFSLQVNQKIGYTFLKNNTTYLMAGIGYNKMEFIYTDVEDEKDNVLSLILGIGHEYSINEDFAIFGEYTIERYKDRQVFSDIQIGNVRVSSQELKLGFRYYF